MLAFHIKLAGLASDAGGLDEFMAAELARKVRGGGPEKVEDVE